ncbi:MAG: TULIP family P47-like protein, partial [Planctomycetaceae bacterium]|nr:TULIP family P47-like protein [Planctomycetaceae bacterium]
MSSDKPASDDAFGLQGWDTVNAISYAKMNRAIAKSGSTPKTFSFKDDTGWSIDGTWQPWDLTLGGSGQNLFLKCTIASGKLNSPFGKSLDLAGQWVVIEVFLNQVPADPSITDPTGKGGKGVSLVVSDQPPFADTKAVTISNSSIDEDTKLAIWKNDFDGTFRSYFNQPQTVKSFTQVFSTILLNSQADTGSFQWIKPTEASYAVGELERKYATLDNSVFAVLAQTEGRNTSKLGQQVDVRILDDLPKDTNSVFAISGARFIDQLVLPGAVGIMTGSKASDFSVDYKGLSVTNKKEVTWRKVTLDDSVGGYTVELKVPVNGFRMSLQGDIIELEFTGVWFDAPQWQLPGHLLVK